MSETRDAFGPLLEKLQAEMRGLRAEFKAFQAHITTLVNKRAEETELFFSARVAESDMATAALFDRLFARLDQTERSVEERLTRIEGKLP